MARIPTANKPAPLNIRPNANMYHVLDTLARIQTANKPAPLNIQPHANMYDILLRTKKNVEKN